MRNLSCLDIFRRPEIELSAYGVHGDDGAGIFIIPSPIDHADLRIIASSDMGWDHVSVSRANRPPNWVEMERIKRAFFGENETVMQLHVPPDDHINDHPNTLHLWRPQDLEIPRPPSFMVGGKIMDKKGAP